MKYLFEQIQLWFIGKYLLFTLKFKDKNGNNWLCQLHDDAIREATLFAMDVLKYTIKRDYNAVLFVFNWFKNYSIKMGSQYPEYFKTRMCYSNKIKFTDSLLSLDYEDIKKVMFYDDLYTEFKNDYIYRLIPDNKLSDDGLFKFTAKVESYPSVKLKQLRKF